MFKKLDAKIFSSNNTNIAKARVKFYGKPFCVEMLARSLVHYNAQLVSKKLEFMNGKYANVIKKLIDSCIANGVQKGISKDSLYVRSLSVGRGRYLKRREFKGRGRSGAIWRPYSNVLLELQGVELGK